MNARDLLKTGAACFVKFALPFGLWLFLFYPAVLGQTPVVGDTAGFYTLANFFINNLSHGVFALWNPFLFFGFPLLLEFLSFGTFNPFWLIILLLHKLGVSPYLSFLWMYIGYFFLGQIGFYLLAKALLKDPRAAFMAFLTLLFSFLGMYIFFCPNDLFIFVPMAWFFYFLECLEYGIYPLGPVNAGDIG